MNHTSVNDTLALLTSTLSAIARLEARGDKPARLTEPDFERWQQFRRRLGWWDLIELLHADAAQQFPVPFDLKRWPRPAVRLDESAAEDLVRTCATAPSTESMDWLRDQSARLGLAGGAFSDAPKFQPAHRVLCLQGTGGRVAAFQRLPDDGLDLGSQFTWVVGSSAEHVAIGLAAVETKDRVNFEQLITPGAFDDLDDAALARFDRVVGLKAHLDTLGQVALCDRVGAAGKWV